MIARKRSLLLVESSGLLPPICLFSCKGPPCSLFLRKKTTGQPCQPDVLGIIQECLDSIPEIAFNIGHPAFSINSRVDIPLFGMDDNSIRLASDDLPVSPEMLPTLSENRISAKLPDYKRLILPEIIHGENTGLNRVPEQFSQHLHGETILI